MRAVAITTLLCAVAGLLGAADKRLAAGQAENDTLRISATVLDAAHLRNTVGSDLGDHYVAVEVTITPKGSEPLVVSLNDFILRSQASGEHSGPLVASQILGAGELVVSRTYANRSGPGEPRLIEGTKVELKNDAQDAASKALEEKLKETILAEKTTTGPYSGLLFFPLEKEKPKNLALSYSGPKGKLRVEFK
jgi:hypothetical protein